MALSRWQTLDRDCMDDFNARDLFAGLAMCGLMTRELKGATDKDKAEWAYDMADAMLAEKEKRDGTA